MASPYFSIVVPTYNRPDELAELLGSLARLEVARERFEVIVVDDGGDEPLDSVVEPFRSRLDLRLLRARHAGCAPARQAGIDVALGEYIVFTDDDCLADPDWLDALERRIAAAPGAAVGGRVVNALESNVFSAASQLLISYLYTVYNADHERARFFTTNNVAAPTDAIRSIGGLDASWSISGGEDRDLWERWRAHGHAMVYEPGAIVRHAHHLDFRQFWRQHYHYGRGAYLYHSGAQSPERDPVRFERLAFYAKLPLYAWREESGLRAPACALLLLVAQAATAAGLLRECADTMLFGRRRLSSA